MLTSVTDLEDALATPGDGLIRDMRDIDGDLVVLGAGGKMGPSLCRLARRALDAAGRTNAAVIAVSRWSDPAVEKSLLDAGVRTATHDLMAADDLGGLPDAANVVFMVGAKFGTSGAEHRTWAVNTTLPALVARRYRQARLCAFSTGNVYPLVASTSGGCREEDPPAPIGEYAMSCLGRERVLEHAAATYGNRIALLRLNYACDLRYGVLADIGSAVLAGRPVSLATGHVNVVWQRYANEVALRALRHAADPPLVLNLTGPETLSVRRVAMRFGALLDREVRFDGTESGTALLSDASRCHGLFGYPDVPLATLVDWQADWLRRGLPTWDKPTHFDTRDGRF